MCEQTDKAVKNTDRELWREKVTDRPGDFLFVTDGGGIGMNCGGRAIVLPIRAWHALAARPDWSSMPVTAGFLADVFDAFCGAEGHNLVVSKAQASLGQKS